MVTAVRSLLALAVVVLVLGTAHPVRRDAPSMHIRADGLVDVAAHAPGTIVRYTLDGSDPGRDAGAWLAPVEVPPGYTLKARAFTAGGAPDGDMAVHATPPNGPRRPPTLVPVTQNRDWRIYDWAERHAEAVALMKARRPEIVMLGDSITHFWGGEPTGGRRTGVAEWDRFFANRRVVNLGYGWDRTENVLWRLTHGELDDVKPAVVVVLIGTNNITLNTPDEIAAGIESICVEINRRSPSTRILLLGLFPRGERPNAARATVAEVNRRIATLDGRFGVTYLDIGSRFLDAEGTISRDVMYDFLHPSAKGYAIWADAMAPTLEALVSVERENILHELKEPRMNGMPFSGTRGAPGRRLPPGLRGGWVPLILSVRSRPRRPPGRS